LLDEPLASLDPLARREFLAVVAEVVRTEGTTVLLSSHIVTDVEPACERLIVLGAGRLRVHDSIAALLASHRIGPADAIGPRGAVSVGEFPGPTGEQLRLWRTAATVDLSEATGPATLEETVMGYLAADRPVAA
jgi:ABC-2 type transport system ATP-binding protein